MKINLDLYRHVDDNVFMVDKSITKQIKKLLIDREISQVQIAGSLGISKQAVNQVIHGIRSTPRIRKAIEDSLKQKIWRDNGRRLGTHKF